MSYRVVFSPETEGRQLTWCEISDLIYCIIGRATIQDHDGLLEQVWLETCKAVVYSARTARESVANSHVFLMSERHRTLKWDFGGFATLCKIGESLSFHSKCPRFCVMSRFVRVHPNAVFPMRGRVPSGAWLLFF
jgi:hypothetical protein